MRIYGARGVGNNLEDHRKLSKFVIRVGIVAVSIEKGLLE